MKYLTILFLLQWTREYLTYLLDVYDFTPEDIHINSQVLTWKARIISEFDAHDKVVASSLFIYYNHNMTKNFIFKSKDFLEFSKKSRFKKSIWVISFRNGL